MSIFIIFISALFVQQIYHLFVFSRIAFYNSIPSSVQSKLPVSVVVCCQNERLNLEKYLPSLIAQAYPIFELLIVDDQSKDDTAKYITEIIQQYPSVDIKYLLVSKSLAGKKEVLYQGVNAAKYEFVLVTDADCKPSSVLWIQSMANAVLPSTDIVLGYAPFVEEKDNFINLISRYENFITACFYLSFAMARIPYMGVGRNMLFKRKLYLDTYQRIAQTNTLSGDDDLFIQYAANRENCEICMDKEAFLYSSSKNNIKDFLNQKARHISTGIYYRLQDQLALAMYPLSSLVILLSYFMILVYQPEVFLFASVVLFIFLLMIWQLKSRAAKRLLFTSHFPLLGMDIFFLIYQIILVILPFKRKNNKW